MEWERAQAGFVDRPAMALHDADTLVASLLGELGYPVDELDQLAEPGAGQPEAIERYRAVRRVNLRADASETTTDELREAFVRYRELFEELLQQAAARPLGHRGRAGRVIRSAPERSGRAGLGVPAADPVAPAPVVASSAAGE